MGVSASCSERPCLGIRVAETPGNRAAPPRQPRKPPSSLNLSPGHQGTKIGRRDGRKQEAGECPSWGNPSDPLPSPG